MHVIMFDPKPRRIKIVESNGYILEVQEKGSGPFEPLKYFWDRYEAQKYAEETVVIQPRPAGWYEGKTWNPNVDRAWVFVDWAPDNLDILRRTRVRLVKIQTQLRILEPIGIIVMEAA